MSRSTVRAANKLLEDLPGNDYRRLFSYFSPIELPFSDVLADRSAPVKHVYFPTSELIAIHSPTLGRASLALVGSDGMIGSSIAAGVEAPAVLIVVQATGTAMRMDARRFRLLADRSISLQRQITPCIFSNAPRKWRFASHGSIIALATCDSAHTVSRTPFIL